MKIGVFGVSGQETPPSWC